MRRLVAMLSPLVVLVVCHAQRSLAAVPEAALNGTWTEVRTERFSVLTDGPSGPAVAVGRRLEQFASALAQANPKLRALPAQTCDVYVLHDAAIVEAMRPPDVENILAFWVTAPGRNLLIIDGTAESDDARRAACHEFTHAYLAGNFSEMPVFLNEGLAEYYSTFRLRGLTAEFGHKREFLQSYLNANGYVPIEILFAARGEGGVYNHDNDLRSKIYAEGWALVEYLQAEPSRAVRFNSFLDGIRGGMTARASFRNAFPTEEWPALVQATGKYMRDDFIDPRTVKLEARLGTPTTTSRAVSTPEALAALGDLDVAEGPARNAAADEFYRAALLLDSMQVRAWAGLGTLADRASDTARAEICFRRALDAGPDDPHAQLTAGLGALNRVWMLHDQLDIHRATELLELARGRFARVLQLDENNAEAMEGFGLTFLAENRIPEAAYRALALASEALPARRDVQQAWQRAVELKKESQGAGNKTGP